jgi:hypothetical protein
MTGAVIIVRTEHASLVTVRVHQRTYDFDKPWQRDASSTRGAGVCVAPDLIIAPAHLVEDALASDEIPWDPDDDVGGAVAMVIAINHDHDLALIQLRPADTTGLAPLELGPLAQPGSDVVFHGLVDHELTAASGFVTKISVERCSNSARHALFVAARFDHDIGQGSGFIAQDGKLAGLCVQTPKDQTGIVEMVPAPAIAAFLRHRGNLPALNLTTQNTNNMYLRRALQLEEHDGGVVVLHADHGSSAERLLEPGDVLLAIDGHNISRHGNVELGFAHVRYDYLLGLYGIGDAIELVIKRRGERRTVLLPLDEWRPLVPRQRHGRAPLYLVFAGFVFQRLTRDYLTTWDEWWNKGPKEFLNAYYLGRRTAEQHELVALTSILEDPINEGYGHLYNELVRSVNGIVPRTFADFVAILSSSVGMIRIETTSDGMILLDAQQARRDTPRICATYEIPRDRTPELPR